MERGRSTFQTGVGRDLGSIKRNFIMKVISKTQTGYLVDATIDELRQISGVRDLGHIGNTYTPDVKLGTIILVTKLYEQGAFLKDHLNDITNAQILLRDVADRIEPIKPIIEPIVTLKEEDSNGENK